MTDKADELKKLKEDLAQLKAGHDQLLKQFAVTHHLVVALAQQCNDPNILRANFKEIADRAKDQLLNTTLTDADIAAIDHFQKLVDKQLR